MRCPMTRLLSILREPMVARHLLAWIVFAAIGAELLTPDREVTRIRNSLLATVADPSSFEWRPDETPPDFLRERGPKPPELLAAARSIGADARDGQGALARSLRIARHLARGGLHGTMLHLDTVSAYQAILATGEGDCSDYTQVFDAISYVADIPVRQWGISFDGFGGSGHTCNEIFDAGLDKWVMVDVFRSFIPIDRMSGVPLSTLEFRRRMRGIDPLAHMRIIPLTRAPSA